MVSPGSWKCLLLYCFSNTFPDTCSHFHNSVPSVVRLSYDGFKLILIHSSVSTMLPNFVSAVH